MKRHECACSDRSGGNVHSYGMVLYLVEDKTICDDAVYVPGFLPKIQNFNKVFNVCFLKTGQLIAERLAG